MQNKQAAIQKLEMLQRALTQKRHEKTLERTVFLPSQRIAIDNFNRPEISILIFTGANQVGKTHLMVSQVLADMKGYQPWDKKKRPQPVPVRLAGLVRDYDNHSRNILAKFLELVPKDSIKVETTQQHAPRIITDIETGSSLHMFTHDQDVDRLEGSTWHGLYVDEPCPRVHFTALQRGLQKTNGKIFMTMTPLSEPWIFDEIYNAASNMGGEREDIYTITAFPDENLESKGGHLSDESVERFRLSLSDEEKEARIHGRFMHLIGRVYKGFDPNTHILDEDLHDPSSCPHGLSVDPHERTPFAMAWYYITPGNDMVFYDEWPKTEFVKITHTSHTISDYAALINAMPKTFFRQMDPNYGRRKSIQTGLSIAEEFALRGIPFDTQIVDDLAVGHAAVQERLSWDRTRELGADNQPSLYVKRNCHNIIRGFNNYVWDEWRGKTGEGKGHKQSPKEKYKDFMDVVRYAVVARGRYLNPNEYLASSRRPVHRGSRGWSGGSFRSELLKRI